MARWSRLVRVGGRSVATMALAGAASGVFVAAAPARADLRPIQWPASASQAVLCAAALTARDAQGTDGERMAAVLCDQPPGAPTNLTAVDGDQSAELTFGAAPDNGSTITGYELSLDAGANWALLATTDNGDGTRTGTATGLTAKTTYQVKVRAQSSEGAGAASSTLTYEAATLPAAPATLTVMPGDGRLVLTFPASDGMGRPVLRYEWRGGGAGPWMTLADTDADGGGRTGTVDGLTNGVSSSIQVRAVTVIGDGDPTDAVAGTPLAPAAPPASVTAVPGTSSVTVSWPASTGDNAEVTGYTVTASPGPATCETTTELSCVLGGEAGVTYTYSVVAHSASGDSPTATMSEPVLPAMPEPPAVPPAGAPRLTTTEGAITTAEPGQEITFVGAEFAAFSTMVLSIYSEPVVLATSVTDADGAFRRAVIVPADLAGGTHTILAQGVDADGNPRFLALAVAVAAAGTDTPGSPSPALPITGGSPWTTGLIGLLLIILGATLRTWAAARSPRTRLIR